MKRFIWKTTTTLATRINWALTLLKVFGLFTWKVIVYYINNINNITYCKRFSMISWLTKRVANKGILNVKISWLTKSVDKGLVKLKTSLLTKRVEKVMVNLNLDVCKVIMYYIKYQYNRCWFNQNVINTGIVSFNKNTGILSNFKNLNQRNYSTFVKHKSLNEKQKQKYTKLKHLQSFVKFEKGVINTTSNYLDKDILYIKNVVEQISIVLVNLTKLSDKGFVNNANVDLPLLEWLVTEFKLVKPKHTGFSVLLNTLYFNLILLLLLNMIIQIEKSYSTAIVEQGWIDLKVDLNTLHKNLLKMINPKIRDKISNKGLSILLTSTVGYDSEFELSSSLKMTNDLLSVQLAGNTGVVLKIPIIDKEPVTPEIFGGKEIGSERKLSDIACRSIDLVINNIRTSLYKENDDLLKNLLLEPSLKELKSETIDNFKVFVFPKSNVTTSIKYVKEYGSKDLINESDNLNNENHESSLYHIIDLLNKICGNGMSDKLKNSIKNSSNKPLSRITYRNGGLRLSITVNRQLYICMHESSADLSILKDFDLFKENLDIVARSFVTLGKPLEFDWCKSKVHFRDTVLIAPAGVKSLAGVGSIYGQEFKKIDIGSYRNGDMRKLLDDNKALFDKYAIQDSLITLKHANSMEDFNLTVGKIGIPLTISGIGKSYVIKEWSKTGYKGYQPRDDILMGNLTSTLTPKGARSIGISNFIVPFIASYRGGRNETFLYGIDIVKDKRYWYDYDLTSCYTTVMSILGHPDVNKAKRLFNKTVAGMDAIKLIFNYVVLEVDFKFPDEVKYPCIPTRVDDDVDIYPREGRSIITGCEYLVAKTMGCRLFVRSGVIVPFRGVLGKNSDFMNFIMGDNWNSKNSVNSDIDLENDVNIDLNNDEDDDDLNNEAVSNGDDEFNEGYDEVDMDALDMDNLDKSDGKHKYILGYLSPFRDIVKELQRKRRQHPKKTFYNYMYKEIGNSIYGQIAMGISGKKTFDVKSKNHINVLGGVLSNPIIASYITGFTRALIGECLNNIHKLNGRVISTTTDGFITDIADLESKILTLEPDNKIFLCLYRRIRRLLTTFEDTDSVCNESALELKYVEESGIITCKTRVQLGIGSGISASTGFQTRNLDKSFLIEEFSKIMNNDSDKTIEYVQTGLRGANDIYKHGGHIMATYKDRSFSLDYDNKRRILETRDDLLDSDPWQTVNGYGKIRLLKETITKPVYIKGFVQSQSKGYKSYIETSVRGFIKACLSSDVNKRYGVPINMFTDYKSIIDFVYKHDPAREVKLSLSSLSRLKNRNTISRTVPRIAVNESFIAYVKENIKSFETDRFFKEFSVEHISNLKKESNKLINKPSVDVLNKPQMDLIIKPSADLIKNTSEFKN